MLTYYPLNNTQKEAVNNVFQTYNLLENGDSTSQQFSEKYQGLGYNPLYNYSLSGNNIMQLYLLSRIDENNSKGSGHRVTVSSIGDMPLVPARDLPFLGIPPRLIGFVEAVGRGLVGYLNGQAVYLNPASHEYVSEIVSALELTPLGITKGVRVLKGAVRPIGHAPKVTTTTPYSQPTQSIMSANTTSSLAQAENYNVTELIRQPLSYWNRIDTHTFKGQTNRVYKRDDLIDLNFTDIRGRTNLQRMKQGKAPIGSDGEPINLHHMLQTHDGAIAEVTRTFHEKYKKVIHINPSSTPSGIDRIAFDNWRNDYWKNRANEILGSK